MIFSEFLIEVESTMDKLHFVSWIQIQKIPNFYG